MVSSHLMLSSWNKKLKACRKIRFRRPSASSEIVNIAKASFTSNKETADTEKQLHASQKKKWSRLRLSDLKRGIHKISMVPTIFPNPLFWNAFRKPSDVRMFFTRWHELCWCSMVGLQECQPPAAENDSTSSLLSLGPKSAPKFPGVCYDGAESDGVLCRFQKFTTLRWSSLMFCSWSFKGFKQVFFHPLRQETPLGMQKWPGKRNVWLEIRCNFEAYFLCHFSIVSIPQLFQGFVMVHFDSPRFTKTSKNSHHCCLAGKTRWACGKTQKKVWANLWSLYREIWQGRTESSF